MTIDQEAIRMAPPDKKIEAYYALRPVKYGLLEAISVRQSVDPKSWNGLTLMIRLASSSAPDAKYLECEFLGIRNLRLGSVDGLVHYRIDIRSIAAAQQEGLTYSVVEDEYGLLSFVCANFTATRHRQEAVAPGLVKLQQHVLATLGRHVEVLSNCSH